MSKVRKEEAYREVNRLQKQGHFDLADRYLESVELDESDYAVDDEDHAILEEARESDPTKLSQRQIDELIKEHDSKGGDE